MVLNLQVREQMTKAMMCSLLVSLHRRTAAGPPYVKLWRYVLFWPFLYDLMSFQVIVWWVLHLYLLSVRPAVFRNHRLKMYGLVGYCGLEVNFGHGSKHSCMSDFCFIFCENGQNCSEQWVAAPYHISIFFNKHSDCKSHFLDIPYQCMFINRICLSSLSFFEVFIFLHINCLFSLLLVMCPNPKYFSAKFLLSDNYLATLHLSFVLVGNSLAVSCSYFRWMLWLNLPDKMKFNPNRNQ